jgi:glycerophosphoryl diester phosphodiesterase
MAAPFPFLDHPGPIPFAHRGGSAERAENSLGAFAHAVDLGYRYLETDTRLTRDGVLVAIHDDRIDRVSDRSGLVAELTWDEIRAARLRAPDGSPTDERIPRLEEVFTAFPEARINVDAKDDRSVDPLIDLIRRLDAVDRSCLGSFSGARTKAMRAALGAGLCTVCGPLEVGRLRLGPLGFVLGRPEGGCAQVPVRARVLGRLRVPLVDAAFVAAAHRVGVPVQVWTIDDRDEMNRLLDLGVDGIMTDRPSVLRDVLVERGEWHGV